MEVNELNRLLQQGEGLRVEFKEAQNGVPDALYDTVTSFLNREGGAILLGVADNGTILGLSDQNLMQLKQDIVTALNNPEVLNPPFPLAVHEANDGNHKLLYIRVPISSFIHKHNNIIYDRENDSDFRITDEARISEMYARKRNVFTENQIYPKLRIEDLDAHLFEKVKSRIALVNANHPWLEAGYSNERILRDARFLRRDFTTGEEGLTLAAALVFGTDEVIGNILPAYKIDIIVRRENMDRYDDRLLLTTNLIDSYLQSLEFIKSKWPQKFYQDTDGNRKDLRELIFRELVANIIIHREYNSATATELIIYEDRIESTNPNRPRFTGPLNLETFEAEPKNPNIRAFFNILTWADEIGSGIRNMNKFVSTYTGGAQPTFIENEAFKCIIPMLLYKIGEKHILYLHLSQLPKEKLGKEKQEVLKELPLDLSLKNIHDLDELALALVIAWQKKSGELSNGRFLLNKELRLDELKKVGTWSEKSGDLLKKRARVLLSTLLLSLTPISLDELARTLEYRSKERYRDDYLKPLRDSKLIEYTLDQANDPNQQYVITHRGKLFLGGSST
ncbi:MAG: putative DNA binding domain-containing protein [Bacteroidales bacterium]|nr:putative DNA binding domain-containing protein [Bacteroidales bacterium]